MPESPSITSNSAVALLTRLIAPTPATAILSPRRPLYVVGDIHGRLDLLDEMVARILREASDQMDLVFTGDYIDRGPDSAGVIRALRCLSENPRLNVTCLRGNHEAMMLNFLDAPLAGAHWLRHGGRTTLQSYGLRDPGHDPDPGLLPLLRTQLAAALAPGEEAFLRRLPLSFMSGNIFVSHAGADPTRALTAQSVQTLLWGCSRMMTEARQDGACVVHGHYVEDHAGLHGTRIGVDTGAFYTGRLSAARITEGALGVLVS
ncbi:metallophosphoesterase family protein [Halovulum sp. GXIMD14793]